MEMLARHILRYKRHPRKSKLWALRYLETLKQRENRVVLTENQKQARRDTKITLSGKTRVVQTVCIRGKHAVMQSLPVEYLDSPNIWTINGRIIANCAVCSGRGY